MNFGGEIMKTFEKIAKYIIGAIVIGALASCVTPGTKKNTGQTLNATAPQNQEATETATEKASSASKALAARSASKEVTAPTEN